MKQILSVYAISMMLATSLAVAQPLVDPAGEIKEIKQALESTSLSETERADYYGRLGQLYYQTHQLPEAESALKNAQDLLNTKRDANRLTLIQNDTNLGIVQQALNKPADAEATYTDALMLSSDREPEELQNAANGLLNLAKQYIDQTKPEDATRVLGTLKDKAPQIGKANAGLASDIWALNGIYEYNAGHYDVAQPMLETAYQTGKPLDKTKLMNYGSVLNALADMHYMRGEFTPANGYYQELLAYNKANPSLGEERIVKLTERLKQTKTLDTRNSYIIEQGQKIHRWNDQTQHVYVYVPDGSSIPGWRASMPSILKEAFLSWQSAMRNRVTFDYVTNPSDADVQIVWYDKQPPAEKTMGHILGQTITDRWGEYISRNDMHLYLNNKPGGNTLTNNELYNTALHEVGHLMGIEAHSPNPHDVMYPAKYLIQDQRAELTDRDIATMQALYQMPAAYTNPPQVRLAQFETFKQQKLAERATQQKTAQKPGTDIKTVPVGYEKTQIEAHADDYRNDPGTYLQTPGATQNAAPPGLNYGLILNRF